MDGRCRDRLGSPPFLAANYVLRRRPNHSHAVPAADVLAEESQDHESNCPSCTSMDARRLPRDRVGDQPRVGRLAEEAPELLRSRRASCRPPAPVCCAPVVMAPPVTCCPPPVATCCDAAPVVETCCGESMPMMSDSYAAPMMDAPMIMGDAVPMYQDGVISGDVIMDAPMTDQGMPMDSVPMDSGIIQDYSPSDVSGLSVAPAESATPSPFREADSAPTPKAEPNSDTAPPKPTPEPTPAPSNDAADDLFGGDYATDSGTRRWGRFVWHATRWKRPPRQPKLLQPTICLVPQTHRPPTPRPPLTTCLVHRPPKKLPQLRPRLPTICLAPRPLTQPRRPTTCLAPRLLMPLRPPRHRWTTCSVLRLRTHRPRMHRPTICLAHPLPT